MRGSGAQRRDTDRGQASIELLGVLPAVLLVVLAAWQLALAGHASWLAGNAARVGARAQVVGDDPASAARGALPSHLRRGLRVTQGDDGRVTVRMRMPLVMRSWSAPVRIGATAALPSR